MNSSVLQLRPALSSLPSGQPAKPTPAQAPVPTPLPSAVPPGRLVEISGDRRAATPVARTTTAVAFVRHAQLEGETTAWIQPVGGTLFPPDLAESGVDLEALLVVQVPTPTDGALAFTQIKAAELLLRSGAFGLVVVDLTQGPPASGSQAWQGRLLGLCRQHGAKVILLTEKSTISDSLGTLIGLRIEPRRRRQPQPARDRQRSESLFVVEHNVLKNKSGGELDLTSEHVRGPWGVR